MPAARDRELLDALAQRGAAAAAGCARSNANAPRTPHATGLTAPAANISTMTGSGCCSTTRSRAGPPADCALIRVHYDPVDCCEFSSLELAGDRRTCRQIMATRASASRYYLIASSAATRSP